MLGIVGQVLVQVAQAVGVLAELVIHDAQLVTRSNLPAGSRAQRSSRLATCQCRVDGRAEFVWLHVMPWSSCLRSAGGTSQDRGLLQWCLQFQVAVDNMEWSPTALCLQELDECTIASDTLTGQIGPAALSQVCMRNNAHAGLCWTAAPAPQGDTPCDTHELLSGRFSLLPCI